MRRYELAAGRLRWILLIAALLCWLTWLIWVFNATWPTWKSLILTPPFGPMGEVEMTFWPALLAPTQPSHFGVFLSKNRAWYRPTPLFFRGVICDSGIHVHRCRQTL
jgi:hypothetical protein